MTKIIVADTGPLIALSVADLVPVLEQLFTDVLVPPTVVLEATKDLSKPGASMIHSFLESGAIKVHEIKLTGVFKQLAELLDQGESEAIALAHHLNCIALIDEKKGRKSAQKLGVKLTGTAAILIQAKNKGMIESVKPKIEKLKLHGYRMSFSLEKLILNKCDE